MGGISRWDNYEMLRPGGSLIVNSPSNAHHTGLSPKPTHKPKLDDLYQRQMLMRHNSDEEFRRYNTRPNGYPSPEAIGREEQHRPLPPQPIREINWERFAHLRKGNSKEWRNSGGRANPRLNLKEAGSTTATEGLHSYKSEKALPSFLRNQTKSPERGKW